MKTLKGNCYLRYSVALIDFLSCLWAGGGVITLITIHDVRTTISGCSERICSFGIMLVNSQMSVSAIYVHHLVLEYPQFETERGLFAPCPYGQGCSGKEGR